MLTNLVRAGLARLTRSPYAPFPTVYDGLFPNGTLLTAPTRRPPASAERETAAGEPPPPTSNP